MKAYDRYANCKIITECDDETSFNCYSYIYGNEYIWYKMGTSWRSDIDLLMVIILKGKKLIWALYMFKFLVLLEILKF